MTAGKWSVTRYEDKLWRVWDGDGYHRATCYTWGWAIRLADRGARAVTALTAGADALTALDRVRDALTEIDRLDDDAWAVWKRDADMYEQGRSDAYEHAHTIITEALEGGIE